MGRYYSKSYSLILVVCGICVVCAYGVKQIDDKPSLLDLEYYDNIGRYTDSFKISSTHGGESQLELQNNDIGGSFNDDQVSSTKRNMLIIKHGINMDGIPSLDSYSKSEEDEIPSSYLQTRNTTRKNDNSNPLDSWSVVWYIASFGGLIAFFLVVSCSEWCCRRRNANNCTGTGSPASPTQIVPESPPPSYHNFAPPSYDSICYGRNGEKVEFDIYVVPVHTFGTIIDSREHSGDEPPSYLRTSEGEFTPAYPLPAVRCQNLSCQVHSPHSHEPTVT